MIDAGETQATVRYLLRCNTPIFCCQRRRQPAPGETLGRHPYLREDVLKDAAYGHITAFSRPVPNDAELRLRIRVPAVALPPDRWDAPTREDLPRRWDGAWATHPVTKHLCR